MSTMTTTFPLGQVVLYFWILSLISVGMAEFQDGRGFVEVAKAYQTVDSTRPIVVISGEEAVVWSHVTTDLYIEIDRSLCSFFCKGALF